MSSVNSDPTAVSQSLTFYLSFSPLVVTPGLYLDTGGFLSPVTVTRMAEPEPAPNGGEVPDPREGIQQR